MKWTCQLSSRDICVVGTIGHWGHRYLSKDQVLPLLVFHSMHALKKEALESLKGELALKSRILVYDSKVSGFYLFQHPRHTVPGTQFRLWNGKAGEIPITEWAKLWSYPSTDFYVFSKVESRHDTTNHNCCLLGVVLDCNHGETLLQNLCDLNTTLNLRLRPWDGLFLDCFASALLAIPWVADLLKSLAEKRFVTLWTIGRTPLESLQSPESYKTDTTHKVLAPSICIVEDMEVRPPFWFYST
ncbi:hypothetical protein R1flu_004474 [Riccia fluitans]|uniref:Uncharacterized protein n=1 Tax=Riccia fluitans TaxID=41844 RepID=A0ABD1YR68_9MARC